MSSDDDIEIIEKVDASLSGNNDICQLCSANLNCLSPAERQNHYSEHKSVHISARATKRTRPRSSVGTSQRKTTPMKFSRKSAESAAPEDIFWYPAQAEAPPDNYTPGILPILKDALKQSNKKGATQRAVLCYERTPHIYRESFDVNWGCGHFDRHVFRYRNFLMLCAALMDQPLQPLYFPHLDDPISPSVRNLQRWLEDAWKHGYDDIGARELEHKLVDTKKKLGTGVACLWSLTSRIPRKVKGFRVILWRQITHSTFPGFDTLTEWVANYFTEKPEGDINKILRTASPIVITNKMPVIMQYEGHSVTIVGYELAKNGKINLLAFNPSNRVDENIRQAALNVSTSVGWASSSSVSLGKTRRSDRSKSPAPKKRSRTNQDPDDGIVSIPDSEDENLENARRAVSLKSTPDPDKVIRAFKLNPPKLVRFAHMTFPFHLGIVFRLKHEYQLLYFTMGDPLSDEEQNERKVVYSVREC
ncbi:peptidase family C78-domain-containing protein [Boletus reticuloceps]|uniref:Peptidase family C78-domain-containing protein n=1 Tax=Boletus reticuloceps TaxID=495285 RepID=A0A8I2YXR6_9AGAM|nr:peptidase family C78-domain-containing protein [Boletus reticuloceps]